MPEPSPRLVEGLQGNPLRLETTRPSGTGIADQVIRAFVASAFDRPPIQFKTADAAGLEPVRRACCRPNSGPHDLAKALNRNAFLYGCHELTEAEPIEHLIVGFGRRHGSTIRIKSIRHWAGNAHSVPVPPDLPATIVEYIGTSAENQVLVFHNHPHSIFDSLLDTTPIASVADRNVMLALLCNPTVAIKTLLQGRQIQWHVGQNGYVREFSTPDLIGLLRQIELKGGRPPV